MKTSLRALADAMAQVRAIGSDGLQEDSIGPMLKLLNAAIEDVRNGRANGLALFVAGKEDGGNDMAGIHMFRAGVVGLAVAAMSSSSAKLMQQAGEVHAQHMIPPGVTLQ